MNTPLRINCEPVVTVLKRGTRFVHAQWLDATNAPLECVVTRIAKGVVYWRPANGGRPTTFNVDDTLKHVRKVLP